MMHRCSSICTCGTYHSQGNSFSMLFSNGAQLYRGFDEEEMYSFAAAAPSSSPSSSVDCTLSLGTPSTRLTNENIGNHHEVKKRSSCMSNFGWNILPSKHTPPPSASKGHRGGGNGAASGGDPLLARRCANCDTTSTPLWRNGPRGPKSLCNACGIRFKKEERRATAAAASATNHGGPSVDNSWAHQTQKTPCYSSAYGNEFRFVEEQDDHRDSSSSDGGIPFLSWRFNVADRPSLVHDFTR
ncbi:UNVERIFIED_CONTAM: GATA transcription factor 18 [Sesamum radiatum]|uniref:GATA transcription factor 18 n=1 Tax=Sesamum radiatum TaxID=300843 RepID=A0AAW2RFG6_SESRA